MAADPQAAAAELLKNPQFLEMFQKAVGDEKIPDEKDPNRNEWLKKMQDKLRTQNEAEAKQKLEAVQSDEDGKWMWIQPSAGFCIKCLTKKGQKVFINIAQHEKIAEPMPLEEQDSDEDIKYRIPLSCGAGRFDTDKAGRPCKVYDVIVNPNTIKRCGEDSEFRRFVAALTMTWISQKSEPDLNTDEFKNVNFKAKGNLEIQRIRLSAPKQGTNVMGDEIKLPGQSSATAPTPGTQQPNRKMVSEVTDAPGSSSPEAPTASSAKPKPSFEVKPEGLYNWSTHEKPAKNPYFRSNPPAKFLLDVSIPGITTIKEVDVRVTPRIVYFTYVDEEDEGPFLAVQLPFPVSEDPLGAKFVRKKCLLNLILQVVLPDESEKAKAERTPASRDVCEVEAEEEAAKQAAADKEWQERHAKIERMQKEEEEVMKQRKELVAGMTAIQEGKVPPALAEEIHKMPPDQKRLMLVRIESRKKTGDQMDQLFERLPEDALYGMASLIRSELGLEQLPPKQPQQQLQEQQKKPEGKPQRPIEDTDADADKPPMDPTKNEANVVEYNYAKKAESLFGVIMYNRYLFALDH